MPGTPQIKRHLEDAWRSGKLSHAYIISGGTGDARRETADYIAQLLLTYRLKRADSSLKSFKSGQYEWGDISAQDERDDVSTQDEWDMGTGNGTAAPTLDGGQCEAWAKQLASGTHPDLIRVIHEKPASISVDEIRQQLSDTIDIRPYETDHKLYIIDEAEKMTVQAQNAVLKTIEEPPEYASILLLTENPEMFLETIRSRCVNLKLDPAEDEETISPEHAQILRNLTQPRVRDVMDAVSGLKEDKDGMAAFIDASRLWLRDVLVIKTTGDESGLLLKNEAENIRDCAAAMSLTDIEKALRSVDEAQSRLESNVNTELTLQLMLMELSGKAEKASV